MLMNHQAVAHLPNCWTNSPIPCSFILIELLLVTKLGAEKETREKQEQALQCMWQIKSIFNQGLISGKSE